MNHQPIFLPKFRFQECICPTRLNDIISLLSPSYTNYKHILEIEFPSNTITLQNNHLFRFKVDTMISIFGVISDIIVLDNPKYVTIQVTSLKDGNTITINIFDNVDLHNNLSVCMLVMFCNYYIKITNSFEITLQNGINSYNELIGNIYMFIFHALYLKLLDTCPFNNFISLITKPILIRTISKYLITIKQTVYITIEYKYKHNKIKRFPHIKLKAKILIDDGSTEALGYIHDNSLYKLLNLSKNKKMNELIKEKLYRLNSFTLYNNFHTKDKFNYITYQTLKNIYNKQYIIHAIPFMNKNFLLKGNTYKNYIIDKLNNDSPLQLTHDNTAFINGDTYMERSETNTANTSLKRRPCLKILAIDEI